MVSMSIIDRLCDYFDCRNGESKAKGLSIGDGVMDWIWMVWMEPSRPLESASGPPIGGVDEDKYQEIGVTITPKSRARSSSMHIV